MPQYLVALGFLVVAFVAIVGFAREMMVSPPGWQLAAGFGAFSAGVFIIAWRKFLRGGKARASKSGFANVAAGVMFLAALPFVMYGISQMLGDLMYHQGYSELPGNSLIPVGVSP